MFPSTVFAIDFESPVTGSGNPSVRTVTFCPRFQVTLEEGHWILVFKRSIVPNKEKSEVPLAKKEEKNLTPNCLSIVNQMECLWFMTQRTIVHVRWDLI